jgi:hypothetical protein
MPDTRSHRGKHPEDEDLFNAKTLPILRQAVADLSLLRTRGYAEKSSIKLVGDRYNLTTRQRLAVLGASCSDSSLDFRKQHEISIKACAGKPIAIDGYNLLITIESALSGAFLFEGRDGCYRDVASVHSTYRQVEETLGALLWIGACLSPLGASEIHWYLDSPISNSGRLKKLLKETSTQYQWSWKATLISNPDSLLIETQSIVISSDSWILDHADQWCNLTKLIVDTSIPDARLISLNPEGTL